MAEDLYFDDWGVGSDLGADAAQRFSAVAQQLAMQAAPPRPGSFQQLMQMMGALKGYGDDRMDMQKAAMSRHYVNPPVVPGGQAGAANNSAKLQMQAGGPRGPQVPSLGMLLQGMRR
jgi:hypothetical protein